MRQRSTAISQASRDRVGVQGYMSLSDSTVLTFIYYDVAHVISRTRPSRFSSATLIKLGIGPGDEVTADL